MDYGKIAYLKIQDLDKRITALTNANKNKNSETVIQSKSNITLSALSGEVEFVISPSKSGEVELEFTATYLSTAGQTAEVSLCVDGVTATSQNHTFVANQAGVVILKAKVQVSEVADVTANFTLQSALQISCCYLVARGYLTNSAEKSLLLHCLHGNTNIYGLVQGQTLSLYSGSLSAQPQEIEVGEMDKAQLFYGGNALRLLFTQKGKLKIAVISGGVLGAPATLCSSVSAFCVGEIGINNVIFVAVLNEIKLLTLSADFSSALVSVMFSNKQSVEGLFWCKNGNDDYLAIYGKGKNKLFLSQNGGAYQKTWEETASNAVGISYDGGVVCYYLSDKKALKTYQSGDERVAEVISFCDNALCCGNCLLYRDGKLFVI